MTISLDVEGRPSAEEFEGADSVGDSYGIDLGGAELTGPVTLEIAYDADALPEGAAEEEVFLAFYDEEGGGWVPVGGRIDAERQVIVVETEHLSWWNPFTWNWGAWLAVLEQTLSMRLGDWLDAAELLTTECERSGEHARVDESEANNVIQGCITNDDASNPEFKVINVKSFFVGISPAPDGPGYPEATILGPGDSVTFTASASDLPPVVVYADLTEEAMWRFIAGLVARMLPAGDQIPNETLAFLGDGLPRLVNAAEVVDALEARDARGLADAIYELLTGDQFIEAFANLSAEYGHEHGVDMLSRWTTSGIRQVMLGAAAVNVIVSLTDFYWHYFFIKPCEVAFEWTRTAARSPEELLDIFAEALSTIPGAAAGVDTLVQSVHNHGVAETRARLNLKEGPEAEADWSLLDLPDGAEIVNTLYGAFEAAEPCCGPMGLLNVLGNQSDSIKTLYCRYPDSRDALVDLWLTVRNFVRDWGAAQEAAGTLSAGGTEAYLRPWRAPPTPGNCN